MDLATFILFYFRCVDVCTSDKNKCCKNHLYYFILIFVYSAVHTFEIKENKWKGAVAKYTAYGNFPKITVHTIMKLYFMLHSLCCCHSNVNKLQHRRILNSAGIIEYAPNISGCVVDEMPCLSGVRCRLFAYGPADATAIPKPHHLLPHLNRDCFYLSGTGLPRLSWKVGR